MLHELDRGLLDEVVFGVAAPGLEFQKCSDVFVGMAKLSTMTERDC